MLFFIILLTVENYSVTCHFQMNELYGSGFFPRDTDKNFMFGFDSIKANASEEST